MVGQGGGPAGTAVLRGIHAALPTPMDRYGDIDCDALARLVERLLGRGVEGFYVCGSTGECFLLDEGERARVLETVVEATAGRVPVIAHVGAMSTASAVALAAHAASLKIAAVSATPPLYFGYGIAEIAGYYRDIAEASELPVLVYNVPAMSGRNLGRDGLDTLLGIPGVAGLKHTSMNLHELERVRDSHPDTILLTGYDEVFLPGLAIGSDGMIGSTVNLMPELFLEIRSAFGRGDREAAAAAQRRVNSVIDALAAAPFFPSLKRALRLAGDPCGECRKPFLPLVPAQDEALVRALTRAGIVPAARA